MKLLKSVDLRFKDKKKEKEYISIKTQYIGRDFKVYITIILVH